MTSGQSDDRGQATAPAKIEPGRLDTRAGQHGFAPDTIPAEGHKSVTVKVKLDHCVIHVSDWERSNIFYRDVLGAELVKREVGWAYRFGDTQLNLHGPGLTAAELARLPVQPGNSDLCFEWSGPIEGAIAHLKKCNVAIVSGPMQRFGARGHGTSVYFRDPDGSLMEFITYPQ
jgi:catechol 2,3-dioxygenase-like lactoylglutathione lyase family enzyme